MDYKLHNFVELILIKNLYFSVTQKSNQPLITYKDEFN